LQCRTRGEEVGMTHSRPLARMGHRMVVCGWACALEVGLVRGVKEQPVVKGSQALADWTLSPQMSSTQP
jgi:hypothetical protein